MDLAPGASAHFTIESLAEGVYAAIAIPGGGAGSNAGIIDLGETSLIFDTFLTPRAAADLRTTAENYTHRTINYVINSHWHNDHVRGNQVFQPETEILSTRVTRTLLETRGAAEMPEDMDSAPAHMREIEESSLIENEPLRRLEKQYEASYFRTLVEPGPRLKQRLPGWVFEGRLTFHGSRTSAELIEIGPAHTENDSVLFLPGARILFSADLVFIQSHPFLGEGDPAAWLNALDRLAALEPEKIVPGHGPVGSAEDLQRMRGYIQHIEELAGWLVDRGDPVEAVSAQALPAAYAGWSFERYYYSNLAAQYQRRKKSAKG